MKKIFFPTLAFLVIMLVNNVSVYAQTDRETIRDLMRFYYVASINDRGHTPALLDNAAIMQGRETGGFWTNRNMSGPQALVRSLLSQNGDANLQRITARVLRILNRPIKVNLLDDVAADVGPVARELYGACPSASNKAWPCASNMASSDDFRENCARILGARAPARRDGVWGGEVCMGAAYFSGGSIQSKLATIIHELLHTQDYSDGRGHLFWVGTTSYRYGADGDHYGTEAIPNMASTYKEGAANIMRLLYDMDRLREMFAWFANNDHMLVEQARHAPGSMPSDSVHRCHEALAPSPDVWLYDQIIAAGVRPEGTATANGSTYGLFRIRSLPARFIAHNEYILAMLGAMYAEHVNESKLFNAIADVNSQGRRTSGSWVAMFYRSLCYQALPAGQSLESLLRTPPAASAPKPYLLPLAFADYFTGFRSQSKEEFRQVFENQSYMNDWIDLYWDHARTRVRAAVPASGTPAFGNLTDIAISLGVNASSPDE